MTYTATITDVHPPRDSITVYRDGEAQFEVLQEPTGKAQDYENALRTVGYHPVAFDGTYWTLEKEDK